MAFLHFITGPLAGKRAHLKAARISVGRAVGNTIRIDDPSISKKHLVLIRDGDDYSIEIDSSRPPVAVNGRQIVKTRLRDSDKLQIGSVQVNYHTSLEAKPVYNELDFFADAPPPPPLPRATSALPDAKPKATEVLSLDDADNVRQRTTRMHTASARKKRILFSVVLLALMLGGSLLLFRKEFWKSPVPAIPTETASNSGPDPQPPKIESAPSVETETAKEKDNKVDLPPLKNDPVKPPAFGVRESGLRAGAKIHRTRTYKSHQEAVDAAQPGDSVIFDSVDAKPVLIQNPIRDVQFISGTASWELHADMIDCQFIYHEPKQLLQFTGKMEQCVFFRCPMKRTHLIHVDAVSMYFDDRSPLHPRDNPDQGKTPTLQLTGYVRNVLIHRPLSGSPVADKRFDMNWAPSIRIHATDSEGDGRGTYVLNPIVLGQRAWTPHQITRGNWVTYAHLTTDSGSWADPVFDVPRGNDLMVLSCAFGSDTPTAVEQFALPPKRLKYHDHEEWGHDAPGPAFRGAAMTITGYRTRVVAHGDSRKSWTVAKRMAIPGLHYADGIVAADPYLRQFATERGGVSVNFAEPKHVFIMQPGEKGAEFLSSREQADGSPTYPKEGPEIYPPMFVALKDLRINAGEFDKLQLQDMTGKSMAEIEKALQADRSIFLGAGVYEFKQTIRAGFVVGAGMEKTILKWPEAVDCAQRNQRGLINCTVQGGRFGYNSQAGLGGRTGNPAGLFLRTRFTGQKEAGINLHSAQFMTWQDCEFNGGRAGFTHGQDKGPGIYKGDRGAAGGITIDNLNVCNCTFRNLKHRAIDLNPDSAKLGHVGIHNCLFEDIGDTALHIDGGQTHLIQQCRLVRCASQTYVPAVKIVSHGTLALSHVDVDCSGVKGNPLCVSLKGLAALSRCSIRGLPTALQCEGLLAADRVTSDGNVKTTRDSLFFYCRFKNMDLPDGVAIAKEEDFLDVTAFSVAAAADRTPPPEVTGVRVRTVAKQRRLEWDAVDDPESGIVQYLILSDGKEIGRTPFQYEPPSDIHSPLLKVPLTLKYVDPNLTNKAYSVVAVNGVGLTSDGKEATLRRMGAARAKFLNMVRDEIPIKEFVNVKGKVTQIIDEEGNRFPLAKVGNNGSPQIVIFEPGEIIETP